MRYLVCPLFLLLVLQAGCECPDWPSDPITEEDVPGVYVAEFGDAREDRILIAEDGTFVHNYHSSDDQVFSDTGTWRLAHTGFGQYNLVMDGFYSRQPDVYCYYNVGVPAFVDTPLTDMSPYIEKRGEQLHIELIAYTHYYAKVGSSSLDSARQYGDSVVKQEVTVYDSGGTQEGFEPAHNQRETGGDGE